MNPNTDLAYATIFHKLTLGLLGLVREAIWIPVCWYWQRKTLAISIIHVIWSMTDMSAIQNKASFSDLRLDILYKCDRVNTVSYRKMSFLLPSITGIFAASQYYK